LWILHSKAGVKTEKSGEVAGGESECRDVVALLVKERWSLDILPVKKAKLSATEVPGELVSSGEEDLCQRRFGLSETEETSEIIVEFKEFRLWF